MTFTRAVRQKVYLKVAVTGPSGSGKTFGSLRLAFGLGNRVALVDTENGSGSLYADLGEYDTMEIGAPFTHQKYIAAIDDAVKAGYDVLIVDSLTHAWAGEGGVLDQKSARDARGGNSFTNWAEAGKGHELLKNKILNSPIHIVCTMRSKQDYVIENTAGQKSAPRKVGMAPIQRDGMEYEFTLVLDCDMTHAAMTSKDRTGLFTDATGQITEEYGRRLRTWLDAGADAPPNRPPVPATDGRPAAPRSMREAREYVHGGEEQTGITRDGTPRSERTAPQDRTPAAETPSPQTPNPQTEDPQTEERFRQRARAIDRLTGLPRDVREDLLTRQAKLAKTRNVKEMSLTDLMMLHGRIDDYDARTAAAEDPFAEEAEYTQIGTGDQVASATAPTGKQPALMAVGADAGPGHGG